MINIKKFLWLKILLSSISCLFKQLIIFMLRGIIDVMETIKEIKKNT